jgi:hypothetical protein
VNNKNILQVLLNIAIEVGIHFGTQKCAEHALEAVDACSANFPQEI